MDYEKLYKDALERAKKIDIDEAYASQGIIAKTIFPELRESNDERIRKYLLSLVDKVIPEDAEQVGININDVLVYLEKQKYDRMQPVYDDLDSFESALAKAWKAYNDSGSRTVDGCEDDYVECAHAKGFREGYLFGLEKQKEQKHPNGCFTCDEYKKGYEEGRRNGFTAGYNKAMKEVEQKEQKPELPLMGGDTDTYFDDLRITTKSLTSREWFNEGIKYAQRLQKEQKPNIELIQRSWYMEGYHDREFGQEPRWIIKTGEGGPKHELNPRYGQPLTEQRPTDTNIPEQKPAEWSEEDEQLLGFIYDLLADSLWNSRYAMSRDECLDRLTSLRQRLQPRPSWKPSEDEERLINTSISFLKDFADKGYENAVECIDWLKSKLNGNSGK